MLGQGKIWGILIIIIILSTAISGFIWFYFYNSGDKDSQTPEILIQKYHVMKSDLKDFKTKISELSVTYEENIIGNGIRKYSDSRGGMMLMEIYERNSLVRIGYNTIGDKKIDIYEYYNPDSGLQDHTEYDTDSDGIFDIYEKDNNNDGIISVNEIKINMGGKFLPLGSLGIVAM